MEKRKVIKITVPKETQKEIFTYFTTNSDNRIFIIAKKFNMTEYQIHKIIDLYLDNQKTFKERKKKINEKKAI